MEDPSSTSWIDLISAAPVVGLRFGTSLRSGSWLLDRARPFLDKWVATGQELQVQVEPTIMQVSRADGFTVRVSAEDVNVSFAYQLRVKLRPGDHSYAEVQEARPFTVLLAEAMSYAESLIGSVLEGRRPLRQIGILASIHVRESALPPGAAATLAAIGSPWENGLQAMNGTATAILERRPDGYDRCHHGFIFDRDERPDDASVTLDWQRVFSSRPEVNAHQAGEHLRKCQTLALDYFDRFGAGL